MLKLNNRIHFDSLTSTNDYLKENSNLPSGTVVTTNYQSKGRGRLNHVWDSEKGKNITLSVLLKEEIDVSKITLLTQVAAAAVYKTLESIGLNAKIKKPNDIFIKNRKISGILIESSIQDKIEYVIIGIGLNVNQTDFNQLNEIATSIKKELCVYDVNHITEVLIKYLNKYFEQFLNDNNKYLEICNSNRMIK